MFKNQDWYIQLVDEINTTKTMTFKTASEVIMKGWWTVGKLVLQNNKKEYGKSLIKSLSRDSSCSPQSIYHAIGFAELCPEFEMVYNLGEGESITWHKVVQRLSSGKKKEDWIKCPVCENCERCKGKHRIKN